VQHNCVYSVVHSHAATRLSACQLTPACLCGEDSHCICALMATGPHLWRGMWCRCVMMASVPATGDNNMHVASPGLSQHGASDLACTPMLGQCLIAWCKAPSRFPCPCTPPGPIPTARPGLTDTQDAGTHSPEWHLQKCPQEAHSARSEVA